MSGPKVSVYELSAAEKKRYYEQLEIIKQTELCLQKITRTIRILSTELDRACDAVKSGQEKSQFLGKQIDYQDITQRINDIRDLINKMMAEYKRIQEEYKKDKEGFVKLSAQMDAEREAKLKALQSLVGTIGDSIKETRNIKEEVLKRVEEADDSMREELHAILLGGFAVDFASLKRQQGETEKGKEEQNDVEQAQLNEEKRRQFTRKINDMLAKVLDLIESPDRMTDDLKQRWEQIQKLAKEITSPDYLENFYAITVLPFSKDCMQYALLLEQFDALNDRYKFLCDETGEIARQYTCSKENIEIIEAEINRIEGIEAQGLERDYIDEALEEAMEEMGYDLVGRRETVKKSGRRVKHELYHFGEGTGVDVTFGENGQITMELGGFDTQDRTPDESETVRLIEDMHRFCGEYSALERILEEKGIKRKNISLMPPSADFAQIINTEDYVMVKPVSEFLVKKEKKSTAKEKHAQ